MALHRLLYRRKSCIVLCLLATGLWVIYLIISAPAATDQGVPSEGLSHVTIKSRDRFSKESFTRKQVALPDTHQDAERNQIPKHQEAAVWNSQKEGGQNWGQIQPPEKPEGNSRENANVVIEEKNLDNDVLTTKADTRKADSKDIGKVNVTSFINQTSEEAQPKNDTKMAVVKELGLDKVLEMGEKFKNKTLEVGARVRNKTIEKLVDFGVIQKKEYTKLIYQPVRWELNITVNEIGFIMKDTEFMKKEQNLSAMEYQPLLLPATQNGTASQSFKGFDVTQKGYGLGYCNCSDVSCLCCVRVWNKWMHLNDTACSSINFLSKSQELDFEFTLENKPIFKKTISAEFPPKICMESLSKVAGACILFSHVTSHVEMEAESHKMQLAGCIELDLTLFNRTLSAFPISCFKIPSGEEKELHKKVMDVGNFVP